MASLTVLDKKGHNKVIMLQSDTATVIGRRPDCDIRVPLMQISRKHCCISSNLDMTTINDLGSSNGTFVNNSRIKETTTLSSGDKISIGTVNFIFNAEAHSSDETNHMALPTTTLGNNTKKSQPSPDNESLEGLGFPESEINPDSQLR